MRSLVRLAGAAVVACLTMAPASSAQDFPDDPPRPTTKSVTAPPSSATNPTLAPVSERRTVRRPTLSESAPPAEILKFMENSLQVVADESKPEEVRREFESAFRAILSASQQLLGHSQATEAQKREAIQYQASVLYQGSRMRLPQFSTKLKELADSLYANQPKEDVANFANFLAVKGKHESDDGLAATALPDIEAYMKRFPREEAAIDLLLDVANTAELSGDYPEARAALDKIAEKFKRNDVVEKIPFVKKRYDLLKTELDFDFNDMSTGARLSPQSMRNKVVALHCWATWSQPCLAEAEHLKALRKAYPGDFEVIGIPFDDKGDTVEISVQKFVRERQIPWPQAAISSDPMKRGFNIPFAKSYGIVALPTTILIGRDGRVAATNIHGTPLRLKVESMLGRRAISPPTSEPRVTSRVLDDPPPPPLK